MQTLASLWDGELHWLDPQDGYFPTTGAAQIIYGWEELEEEDILSPFESPSVEPLLRDTGSPNPDPRFPQASLEQAWGTLSIHLTALATILGTPKKQYQHVNHNTKPATSTWSFQSESFVTERL